MIWDTRRREEEEEAGSADSLLLLCMCTCRSDAVGSDIKFRLETTKPKARTAIKSLYK